MTSAATSIATIVRAISSAVVATMNTATIAWTAPNARVAKRNTVPRVQQTSNSNAKTVAAQLSTAAPSSAALAKRRPAWVAQNHTIAQIVANGFEIVVKLVVAVVLLNAANARR